MEIDLPNTLRQMAGGYILARCLHEIAYLGVADILNDDPLTAAELAAPLNLHPQALNRVLRLLSAHGVFQAVGNKYVHSPLSRLLQTDHPRSMRMNICNAGSPIHWAIYQELDYSLRTNHAATEKVFPEGFWDHLAGNPAQSKIFNQAMEVKSRGHIAGVISAYDFSQFDLIADIGGGHGQLLQAILERSPHSKGILFDQAHVIDEVREHESDRLTLRSGDFFEDELPACDLYLLMEVLHDWDDEHCLLILQAVRKAMLPHSKLLVIERIYPEGPGPDWTKTLDIQMLTIFGGKQRSQSEHETLFSQAGLSMECDIDTGAGVSIIEVVLKNDHQRAEQSEEIFTSSPIIP